jgi:hypothetical protein
MALWPVRMALALLSGLSVWPLMSVLTGREPLNLLLTGGVFGALVLVPFIESSRARLARVLGLVAGAALIHWGAVMLAIFLDLDLKLPKLAVYAIPGLVGALLAALLTAGVAPLPRAYPAVTAGSLAGLAGGVVFGITPESDFWVWGDYIAWQVLVCLGLHFGSALMPTAGRDTVRPQ